jgi:hypothetical protein
MSNDPDIPDIEKTIYPDFVPMTPEAIQASLELGKKWERDACFATLNSITWLHQAANGEIPHDLP